MATRSSRGDGPVLSVSRFKISDGVVERAKALRECLLSLKVLSAAGSSGGRELVLECSRAFKMIAYDSKAIFEILSCSGRVLGR